MSKSRTPPLPLPLPPQPTADPLQAYKAKRNFARTPEPQHAEDAADQRQERLGFGSLLLGVHDAQGVLQNADNVGSTG